MFQFLAFIYFTGSANLKNLLITKLCDEIDHETTFTLGNDLSPVLISRITDICKSNEKRFSSFESSFLNRLKNISNCNIRKM